MAPPSQELEPPANPGRFNPKADGRMDGRHRDYLEDHRWKGLDDGLYNGLSTLAERSVQALESLPIWPHGTIFYRDPVPVKRSRHLWFDAMANRMNDSDLLFLDPDNGLGDKRRHATVDEVRRLRRPGRALVLIRFPHFSSPHSDQLERYHSTLRDDAGAHSLYTLRTSVSVPRSPGSPFVIPRIRWFTIIDGAEPLIDRVQQFRAKLQPMPNASTAFSVH